MMLVAPHVFAQSQQLNHAEPGTLQIADSLSSLSAGSQEQASTQAASQVDSSPLGQVAEDLLISPALRLDAFPALSATDNTLQAVDVSHERALLIGNGQVPGLDVSASYVWESPRFGQFVVSTNTSYVYNTRITDAVSDTVAARTAPENAALFGKTPELLSSVTLTWQFGNHSATAVTSYNDRLDHFGRLNVGQLNLDQLNELVGQMTTVDLRYGYNLSTGRQSNASFSLGVRNMFDRRPVNSLRPGAVTGGNPEGSEHVAYGTIKYQF